MSALPSTAKTRRRLIGLAALLLLVAAAALLRHPPGVVAGLLLQTGLFSIKDAPLRREYEDQVARLCDPVPALRAQGLTPADIARKLHRERRALGVRYKDLTPEPLRARIYEVNRRRYGDPLGPSFEHLEQRNRKDGAVDYEAIIRGACRTNRDVDKLLQQRPPGPPPGARRAGAPAGRPDRGPDRDRLMAPSRRARARARSDPPHRSDPGRPRLRRPRPRHPRHFPGPFLVRPAHPQAQRSPPLGLALGLLLLP